MADINVTINPAPSVSATVSAAPEVDVTIGDGIPKHAVTHAPGGSDSLEAYYATTGSLAYVSGLTTGIGNTGYLTGYVSKTETGDFYPASNPSGFITGVDLSNYVTGQVVRPSETGDFITNSETGVFYPTSNPSGFITGVDLSSYATTAYVTGVSGSLQTQITNLSNSTGSYATGSVVRPSDTGAFLTTGAADGRYALRSATGVFITTGQTGVFASQAYVTGVSGHLQTQVTAINNQTGNFALKSATGNFITTSQTGQFVGTSQTGYYTGIFYPYNSNPLGYVQGAVVRPSQTGIFLSTGAADGRYVALTGNQTISGNKKFVNSLVVGNGSAIGSGAATIGFGNYVSGSNSIAFGYSNNIYNLDDTFVIGYGNEALSGLYYPPNDPENPITLEASRLGFILGNACLLAHSGAGIISATDPSQSLNERLMSSGVGTLILRGENGVFVRGTVIQFDKRPTFEGTGFLLSGESLLYSETGNFADLTSNQTISGVKNFTSRPTVNGTGVLLSGEGGAAANTGELTGVFYPLNSNPSGYITGVDLSSYATQSFVTGVSGHLQGQVNTLNGQTGNYVTGSVVRPSETGNFVTTGQTGVFVTGSVVRPSETGNFITTAQTGAFYPSSNPSGFITGVDLSAYVTGAVVRPSETGAFLTTGAADGRYALQSATGNFITTAQTGAFYPISNPSGFITGVDLSSYATQSFVTGISGDLQTKLNTVSGYAVTGYDDSITGISVTGNSTKTITLFQRDGGNLSASFTDASGALLENVVYTTGNQDISGLKDFQTRPTVTDIPVLISGDPVDTVHLYAKNDESITIYKGQPVYIEGANGSNPLIKVASNTGEFSSSKTIGLLAQNLLVNELGYIITEGILEGFDTSAGNAGDPMWLGPTGNILYGTGNKPYGLNNLVYLGVVLRSQANNGKVYVQIQNGFEMEELHNVYALNPSNKDALLYNSASGAWFARQITTGDVSGISNYVLKSETGNFITTSQTGQFVGDSETGAFLTTGAADNRYALQSATGNFITTAQTGQFVSTSSTGAFLTTGAADARYYGLANGQSISGYAITGYNDAVTGISISGDATKTITLFQKGGTAVSGSFTDNGGSVSDVVYTTGDQTISGVKTFTGTILAVSGIIGSTNVIQSSANSSIIAGISNQISGSQRVVILGGNSNQVTGTFNLNAAILGGSTNKIEGSSQSSVILAGVSNKIQFTPYALIGGGASNTIRENSIYSCAFNQGNIIDTSSYSAAFGSYHIISGAPISCAFGYGTKADRYGMKTFGSDYFTTQGDAQHWERTLYALTQNGETKILSSDIPDVGMPENPVYYDLLNGQANKVILSTIKVLGVDEDANVSQYMRKAVISVNNSNVQQIKHIESIGTDLEEAGQATFSIDSSTFKIIASGLVNNQTRWMAHVDAIELKLPPAYP